MVNYGKAVAFLVTVSGVRGFAPRSESALHPGQLRLQLSATSYLPDDEENQSLQNFRKDVDRLSDNVKEITSQSLESLSRVVTDEDIDLYEAELAKKKRNIQERSREYQVTLPLTEKLGVTLCQADAGQEFSDVDLNVDTLKFQAPPASTTSDQRKEGEVVAMNPCEVKKRLDANFRGVVISSVVKGGRAWQEGIRPGDTLISTSATMGDVSSAATVLVYMSSLEKASSQRTPLCLSY
jgi:S1-C subfamily serine protease